MAPARSCRSPGPRLGSGHLAVVGSHGTLSCPLAPGGEPWLAFPLLGPRTRSAQVPPPPRGLPCFPQGHSGCTSAMSAETSRCYLQTSSFMEPFQGHWAGSSPLPSTSNKQVEFTSLRSSPPGGWQTVGPGREGPGAVGS